MRFWLAASSALTGRDQQKYIKTIAMKDLRSISTLTDFDCNLIAVELLGFDGTEYKHIFRKSRENNSGHVQISNCATIHTGAPSDQGIFIYYNDDKREASIGFDTGSPHVGRVGFALFRIIGLSALIERLTEMGYKTKYDGNA